MARPLLEAQLPDLTLCRCMGRYLTSVDLSPTGTYLSKPLAAKMKYTGDTLATPACSQGRSRHRGPNLSAPYRCLTGLTALTSNTGGTFSAELRPRELLYSFYTDREARMQSTAPRQDTRPFVSLLSSLAQ